MFNIKGVNTAENDFQKIFLLIKTSINYLHNVVLFENRQPDIRPNKIYVDPKNIRRDDTTEPIIDQEGLEEEKRQRQIIAVAGRRQLF